ncbi:hypothetical protein AMECASPLE_007386 [Ameca splendens]|uniref:Uncharacterized protein n=1 Tax=Ameca splendens TaxID=208324 RepID=A0ABV0Z9C7_9TELE
MPHFQLDRPRLEFCRFLDSKAPVLCVMLSRVLEIIPRQSSFSLPSTPASSPAALKSPCGDTLFLLTCQSALKHNTPC